MGKPGTLSNERGKTKVLLESWDRKDSEDAI